jgi:hypothetical protein
MAITIVLLVAAILLIGVFSIAVLAILAIGIHGSGRSRLLNDMPRTHAESITRKVLGTTVRSSNTGHGAAKED